MKKKIIAILTAVIILMLNVGMIFADTPTPEPTITPNPAYMPEVSSTLPSIGSDFSCPFGGVAGWGSCTPAPLWMFHCSHCVRGLPTAEPEMTATPTPDPGDPTKNYVYLTSNMWQLNGAGAFITEPEVDQQYISEFGLGLVTSKALEEHINYINTYAIDMHITATARTMYCGYYTYYTFYFESWISEDVTLNFYGDLEYLGEVFVPHDSEYQHEWMAQDMCYPTDEEISFTVEATIHNAQVTTLPAFRIWLKEFQQMSSNVVRHAELLWYQTSYVPPGSGGGDSYCDEIVCYGETGYEELGFGHSGLMYGATYCLDLGPILWEIWGVGIDIPWIAHLCFTQVSMGEILLLGVLIDLDMILLTITVSWALFYAFVS